MANDIVRKLWRFREWAGVHKGISAAILAVIVTGGVVGGVSFLEHGGATVITTREANVSFTTTVVGLTTNANQTPLEINGAYYNMTDIQNFAYTANGNGGTNSTVSMSTANFLDGDYAAFNVTIKNTGDAALLLNTSNNNVTIKDYFIDSSGNYIAPSGYPTTGNTTFAMNYTGFGNDSLTTFVNYLYNTSLNTNWLNDWGSLAGPIPHEIVKGQSFTFELYVGLGSQAAYPIPDQFFSISIPLTPAR